MALAQVDDVALASRRHSAQCIAGLPRFGRTLGQVLAGQGQQRIGQHFNLDGDTGGRLTGGSPGGFELRACALGLAAALPAQLGLTLHPLAGLLAPAGSGIGVLAPLLRILVRLAQAVGVLVGRIALQGFHALAGHRLCLPCRLVGVAGVTLGIVRLLQRRHGLVARLAGIVETGLRLAQFARLAPRQHPGIDPIATLELDHRLLQATGLVQPGAVFLQLVERLGDIAKQLVGQRRQRLAQGVGQPGFVGLLRQLRLAQLDQGVHQCVVAAGAQLEQALVHGVAIGLRAFEQLAPPDQRFFQAFAGEHLALCGGQPQVLPDARIAAGAIAFEQEIPAVHLRAPGHRRQAHAQGQVACAAVTFAPAELDPAVADPARIAAQQQVPGHLLAGVAVRFDPRRTHAGVEQQRQGQRQHLGLAGAVVAAQQQVAVMEPEFLAVVVEQLHQTQAQRLPAFALRLRQLRTGRRRVEQIVGHAR